MKAQLPQFKLIDVSSIESELKQRLHSQRMVIDHRLAEGAPFDWDNFIELMETLNEQLHRFWSPIAHLNAVLNTPELRKVYERCLPLLSDYWTDLSHNQQYYEAVQSIANDAHYQSLDFAQKHLINDELRDFKLAGVGLSSDKKKTLAGFSKKLSQLTMQFSNNVLDATQAWTRLLSEPADLAGFPDFAKRAARNAARQRRKEGWLLTLEMPSYLAVMQYAQSPELRKSLYYAFTTRASHQGPNAGRWDNSQVMEEILSTRFAMANLLGFKSYADYSLSTKMLDSTDAVLSFLHRLLKVSSEKAKTEWRELQDFALSKLSMKSLEAWDVAYVSEKQRQAHYDFSQEDLRPYFPEHQVLSGLFELVKRLFNVTIKPVSDADTWHADVECYVVCEQDRPVSYFYLDLYARGGKRSGAWMDDCQNRRRLESGVYQMPIAFIVCNFNPPIDDDPALLTHEEVVTLFHEFGHALQHMLTRIDYAGVAGLNGVPWDAVEVVSQFMENFAWEKEILDLISAHYKTGVSLPESLFKKMRAVKNFHSALQMQRQLEFALFDFYLHMTFDASNKDFIAETLKKVRAMTAVYPVPDFNCFQHSFSHVFAGGYAAGYYSYKWAEAMAQDIFSVFKRQGLFDQTTAQRFRDTFLAMGGAKEPMDLFVEFCGRQPTVDALLMDSGIIE